MTDIKAIPLEDTSSSENINDSIELSTTNDKKENGGRTEVFDEVDLEKHKEVKLEEVKLEVETGAEPQKVKKKKLPLKEVALKTILPEEGKYFPYFFGIIFDSIGIFIWLMVVIFVVPTEQAIRFWYMPLIGILGATFAMATPAGGGVFYFPFLTLSGFRPEEAVAFNIATASISMGIFGSASWIRKSRSSIIVWVVIVCTVFGWIGTLFSIFLPITEPLPLRIIFLIFSFFLLLYVIYLLWKGSVKGQHGSIGDFKDPKKFIAVAFTGLVGGLLVGYIGVGIDMAIFLTLNAGFRIDSRKGTGTGILIMGWTALFPFWLHLFYFKNVPMYLWAMTLGGCIVGARLGVLINKLLGRRKIMYLFAILLLAEVIRTPIELGITQSKN